MIYLVTGCTFFLIFFSLGGFVYGLAVRAITGNITMVVVTGVMAVVALVVHILATRLEKKLSGQHKIVYDEGYDAKGEFIFFALLVSSAIMLGATVMAFSSWIAKEIDWRLPIAFLAIDVVLNAAFLYHNLKNSVHYDGNGVPIKKSDSSDEPESS